jgi:hypothetical protein
MGRDSCVGERKKSAQHALAADLAFGLVSSMVCSSVADIVYWFQSCAAGQTAEAQAVGQPKLHPCVFLFDRYKGDSKEWKIKRQLFK